MNINEIVGFWPQWAQPKFLRFVFLTKTHVLSTAPKKKKRKTSFDKDQMADVRTAVSWHWIIIFAD